MAGYTAADASFALGRVAALVAEGRVAPSFPEGAPCALPNELQARWQVVADSAGGEELAPGSLPELKLIYGCVTSVVASCGASSPDAFDVYEACFEALTKCASCAPGAASRELLFLALSEIHEEYDVLLSCVETYEWVQPGATGLLRLWMLQVIFTIFGCRSISARDLMELTDNDVAGAVSLIAFILRCDQAPFELQEAAGRCLVQLTAADSVFIPMMEAGGEDLQSQQIARLTTMLNHHVNDLIKGIIQFEIVHSFGICICQHQQSHARTDLIIKNFLTTIHNCLLYCSQNQKKLRQHLTASDIVQDIMLPYVSNILPALYSNPACGPALIEWQNLKSAMQTFAVVTFNVKVFRPQLRDCDTLLQICQVPNILSHVSMLELLIKIAINVDFTAGPHKEALAATLQGAFERLPEESRARLQRRLTSEQSMRLPFARSSVEAIQALSFALAQPAQEAPEVVEKRKVRRRNRWRRRRGRRRRGKMFAMQQAQQAPTQEEEEPEDASQTADDDEEDSDDDMPPLIPADQWTGYLGGADEAGNPSGAVCQLTGALMHDPVTTPAGHVFERAALEDWMSAQQTEPLTGAPLAAEQVLEAAELQSHIQGYQMQMLSACSIAPEAFDELADAGGSQATAPAAAGGQSLLGELPQLPQAGGPEERPRKAKAKIRIQSRSVVDCPDDMRCAIDGKVMVNPVRSPYGHTFEQKTLEKWMANCGSVCPITGRNMRADECTPDAEMKRRIVKFLRGEA